MNIVYADEFRKRFHKLPSGLQRLYRIQETRFKENWHDPRLHVKKLTGQPLPFSFRVTRNYRVLFIFIARDAVLMATIDNRKDIYR